MLLEIIGCGDAWSPKSVGKALDDNGDVDDYDDDNDNNDNDDIYTSKERNRRKNCQIGLKVYTLAIKD